MKRNREIEQPKLDCAIKGYKSDRILRSHCRQEDAPILHINIEPLGVPNSEKGDASISFKSCLHGGNVNCRESSNSFIQCLLMRSLNSQELKEESWLSSSLMNLVLSAFAKIFDQVHFMPVDFTAFDLNSAKKSDYEHTIDIIGRPVNYEDPSRPIVLAFNSKNIHWNLIRIIRSPIPELQLFEPMGKPISRRGGLNFRIIPRNVINWLDSCCPLTNGSSWASVSDSAITNQQQLNSYDCGVACLLYAEKCGDGQSKAKINEETEQCHITKYRRLLQNF